MYQVHGHPLLLDPVTSSDRTKCNLPPTTNNLLVRQATNGYQSGGCYHYSVQLKILILTSLTRSRSTFIRVHTKSVVSLEMLPHLCLEYCTQEAIAVKNKSQKDTGRMFLRPCRHHSTLACQFL